jgi:hypothetical protein
MDKRAAKGVKIKEAPRNQGKNGPTDTGDL